MRPFTFQRAEDPRKALAAKNAKAQFIAGGTNLVDLMKKNVTVPDTVIDVTKALPANIEAHGNGIRIGAMVRNSTLATDNQVLDKYPLVAKAVLAGASPQIRNMASVGGNLLQRTRCPYFYDTTLPCNKREPGSGCGALHGANRMMAIVGHSEHCVAVHPSDLCVALAALDATVVVSTHDNKETMIPFKDFHRLPGNTPEKDNNLPAGGLITAVDIPAGGFHQHYAYVKIRDRESYAFALISVAAALQLDGQTITEARLASGGVAHKPWRWHEAEAFLKGKTATPAVFSQAAAIAAQGAHPLSDNAFKVPMLKGAIEVALQNCLNA